VTIGASLAVVDVVARVHAFPGMQPTQPLLVIPYRALSTRPVEALTYVWASGPPRQVAAALERSSLSPSYVTVLANLSRDRDVVNVTRTYGFLRIVAFGILLLALVALMLYLSGRERSQLVSSAFLRRMGFSQRRQALSVALEASFLVALATVTGLAAALVTAGAIVAHVDPLAQYSPAPVTNVPWALLLFSGLGAIAAAGSIGAVLTLAVRRSDVGEALRVA
jgi:predicted lysophospholipase L1 biosynthesis ABC-type transport system permease subunit